ncbi:DUF460 domain-containing protein [Candidatus Woesearchaeota archaeon]|nr:DUF460 domain-containing protein [Candidatus Woesearchaeota archaeon]
MNSLILGIDPGSTIGYAVLDFDGNLLHLGSVRNSNISNVISKIKNYGKVAVVGADVNPAPKFVNKFASNFGAELITPKDNPLFRHKQKLAKEFLKDKKIKTKDRHQMAALAAALIAFKHYQPLFNRINNHLVQVNKEKLIKEVRNTVILEKVSIKKALELHK